MWDKPASQQTLRAAQSLAYLAAPETPPPSEFVGGELLTTRFQLLHQGTLGHPYLLQSSTSLSNWLTLGTNTPDAGGTISFDDTNTVSTVLRFYGCSNREPARRERDIYVASASKLHSVWGHPSVASIEVA